MRYNEISESVLTEAMLQEAFLDSIKKKIGDKINDQINVVNNTTTAMQVLYRVASDPHNLEMVTFQLKKAIKSKLKEFQDQPHLKPLCKIVSRVFPSGRGLKDFLVGLILVGVLNGVKVVNDAVKDETISGIVDKLTDLDSLIGHAANGTGLFSVFQTLKVGDQLVFKLLSAINQKIEATA